MKKGLTWKKKKCNLKRILRINISLATKCMKHISTGQLLPAMSFHTSSTQFDWNVTHLLKPKATEGNFRRKILYPEKYTVQPVPVQNLGGRDPNTGRVITARWGGGIKHKYHWVDWYRKGPVVENEYYIEKVIQIMTCGCRTAKVALVGSGSHLRYILATLNMQPGDLIRTSQHLPRVPIQPNEGDAYPLGALPVGTLVHCIEREPGEGGYFIHSAGSAATILRKVNDRVVVKMPSKLEISFPERCMATVGQISNAEHQDIPIGSPNEARRRGRRMRSGLFQKKTGRFGRKIKPPPPVHVLKPNAKPEFEYMRLTLDHVKITFPPGHVKTPE